MTDKHDEALVERVTTAALNAVDKRWPENPVTRSFMEAHIVQALYPPAQPKTRLQVARELVVAALKDSNRMVDAELTSNGTFDSSPSVQAVLAALALPQMED